MSKLNYVGEVFGNYGSFEVENLEAFIEQVNDCFQEQLTEGDFQDRLNGYYYNGEKVLERINF